MLHYANAAENQAKLQELHSNLWAGEADATLFGLM